MKTKVFKTIDEQIYILQARGLIIDDIDFAKDTLIRENYFFVKELRILTTDYIILLVERLKKMKMALQQLTVN